MKVLSYLSARVFALTLAVQAFAGQDSLFAQKNNYQISAVAFYNVENLFDTEDDPTIRDEDFTPQGSYNYTEEIYRKKLHNLATVISGLAVDKMPDGPALIGLAEIENRKVLKDLVNQPELKDRKLGILHFDSPDSRGIDVAMLYHPRYFKPISATALPVKIVEGEKAYYTRDVLYVSGIMDTDTFHVFVNHWPSRSGGEAASAWKRQLAAKINKDVIDSIRSINPNANIIVMGDLNDDPDNLSVNRFLDAVGDKKEVSEEKLFNPFWSFHRKGIGTLGYRDSWNVFDQIIVSSSLVLPKEEKSWKYYQAEIFNRKFLIQPFGQYKGYPHRSFSGSTWMDGYSDHFPVLVYMIKELSN